MPKIAAKVPQKFQKSGGGRGVGGDKQHRGQVGSNAGLTLQLLQLLEFLITQCSLDLTLADLP